MNHNALLGRRGDSSMTALRRMGGFLNRLLAAIGLVTVLVMATPIVSWWALAYSGPLQQPKGDVLILLSAAADDKGGISFSSYWRARHALLAWQTGGFRKVVVTGAAAPASSTSSLSKGFLLRTSLLNGNLPVRERTQSRPPAFSKTCLARRFCSPAIFICTGPYVSFANSVSTLLPYLFRTFFALPSTGTDASQPLKQ